MYQLVSKALKRLKLIFAFKKRITLQTYQPADERLSNHQLLLTTTKETLLIMKEGKSRFEIWIILIIKI